jgi:hypothetical protein
MYRSAALRFSGPATSAYETRMINTRLITTRDGDEVILICQTPETIGSIQMSIINASNGHPIESVDLSFVDLASITVQPHTDVLTRLSCDWTPEQRDNAAGYQGALKGYRMILVYRYSRRLSDFLSPLPTDVVLFPFRPENNTVFHDMRVRPEIQLMAKGGLTCLRTSNRQIVVSNVMAHSLISTKDGGLREAVEAELKFSIPWKTIKLGNIFYLANEEIVKFELPPGEQGWNVRYTDVGQAVLDYSNLKYLLNFD